MHANYHRKDSAIIQEGFQRFRATEICDLSSCTFSGQKTTHFHCCRPNCIFTFKNKADMGKFNLLNNKFILCYTADMGNLTINRLTYTADMGIIINRLFYTADH